MKKAAFSMMTVWTLLIPTVLFNSASFASSDLEEAANQLQVDRMKVEDQNAKTTQTLTDIAAQKAALEQKQREIEEGNKQNLANVKKEFPAQLQNDVMALSIPNCKITKVEKKNPDDRQDYYVEGQDASGNKIAIRFYFHDKCKNRTAKCLSLEPFMTPAPVQPDGTHPVQFEQPAFDPTNEAKTGFMQETIQILPISDANGKIVGQQVIHAVFTGEAIGDQWGGLSSSNAPRTLTCLIH